MAFRGPVFSQDCSGEKVYSVSWLTHAELVADAGGWNTAVSIFQIMSLFFHILSFITSIMTFAISDRSLLKYATLNYPINRIVLKAHIIYICKCKYGAIWSVIIKSVSESYTLPTFIKLRHKISKFIKKQ